MLNQRSRGKTNLFLSALLVASLPLGYTSASWDGDPSLSVIDFSFESFLDINAYQFRPSEDVKWYEVENGYRVTGGSLDYNLLYLQSDLRLKQDITPNVTFRLSWLHEELYEPRQVQGPLLEIEVLPKRWPFSLSVIGTPAYAKREADLGLALTMGERPSNYLRLAWLSPDNYYNDKNVQDESSYRTEPRELTVEAAYQWADRYRLSFQWQDNSPLKFVPDDQVSLFSHQSRSVRATFDYMINDSEFYGLSVRGFDTLQSLDRGEEYRTQDIRYTSVEGYWVTAVDGTDEWTVGARYDSFIDDEAIPADTASSFDYIYKMHQLYTTYHHPFTPNHAWMLGLYGGKATKGKDYADRTLEDSVGDSTEVKFSTGLELFSADKRTTLNLTLSLNLDELGTDPADGGMMRFSSQF